MKQYCCKNCGAVLYWNAESSSLECEYCLEKYNVSDFDEDVEENVKAETQEPELVEDENIKATDESEEGDLVIYKCDKCAAEVVTSKSTIATTCAFCGDAISITNKIVDNFRPEFVVPFKITKEQAMESFKAHMKKGVLTPPDFETNNELEKVKGVYAPFWLHSFKTKSDAVISAENVTSRRSGDDKINTHVLYEVDVEAEAYFKNIPSDALNRIDDRLMDSIEPFDYSDLKNFSPAYMAGYYAEEYNENSEDTFERARKRATDTMKDKILKDIGNYTTTEFKHYSDNIINKESHYAMIPVWLFHVKYKGKNFLYAVNGQTGKSAGNLPVSGKKVALYSLYAFLGAQAALMLYRVVTYILYLM